MNSAAPYKQSNAAVPASWAKQFGSPTQSTPPTAARPATNAASLTPMVSMPATGADTHPSTESVWARQFGSVAAPVANRPSSEAVWAKQFQKPKASTATPWADNFPTFDGTTPAASAAQKPSSPGNTITQAQIDEAIRNAEEAAKKSRAARQSGFDNFTAMGCAGVFHKSDDRERAADAEFARKCDQHAADNGRY